VDWKKIININQFKRFTKQNINESYILITHREINTRLKRLSKIHCLYTNNKRYLLPEKIYKNGQFNSNIIYNYLHFNNKLYRICSRGCFSIYNFNNYIDISEIKNEQLYSICKHYYNHNQMIYDILSFLVYEQSYSLTNIYLMYNNIDMKLIYSYQSNKFDIIVSTLMPFKSEMNIYVINLYIDYLIIYYSNKIFKIIFKNDEFVNDDINILTEFIYKKIDIKIDITLEYIKNIFYTIKGNQLIMNL